MEKTATIYLVPVGMSDAPLSAVLPSGNVNIVRQLKYFIVENIREARRFLKRLDPGIDISSLTFFELNRHTDYSMVSGFLTPLRQGADMGVMSDAGCPAVADPGALVVSIAQEEGFRVKPLVGPSSILMAVMASGFNGQGFAFHGYLPIEDAEKSDAIKKYENESRRNAMTQIFIETPYRNTKLLKFLIDHLSESTLLCVACDLTDPEREFVKTLPPSGWRALMEANSPEVAIDKRPAVFLIYAGRRDEVQQTKSKISNHSRTTRKKHR